MQSPLAQPQVSSVKSSVAVQNINTNDIHVWRMRIAVVWSIILQFILLLVFILCVNVNIFHPITWLVNCVSVFLSLSVWVKFLVFVGIIYIQGEVCKKDYVTGPVYHTTRFQKLRKIFSLRNVLLLMLHMLIGITIFWIYSSVSASAYHSLTKQCTVNTLINFSDYCLVESKLFFLLAGLWLGLYYFGNDYMFGSRNLEFPLIQQYKMYRVKAALKQNIKRSVRYSVLPTGIFLILYYLYGGFVRTKVIELFSYKMETEPIDSLHGLMDIQLIFSLWLFSSIFIVALQMMELLFNVYLTEHCSFPVTTTVLPPGNYLSLIGALKMYSVPIIHHLGHLDLFLLSTKFQQRRDEIFTLSHPGGHPHSWNGIFTECSNSIKTFTNELNQAIQKSANIEKETVNRTSKPEVTGFHFHSHNTMRKLASPISNNDLSSMRHSEYQSAVEVVYNNFISWLNLKLNLIYKKPVVAYFFGESPDSRINYLFCQCQPVIWAVQSLAFLTAASLTEDRYGIVQRDLADIITTLINLKLVLDKLFKQHLIVKKSFANDSIDIQMKYLLRSSVKRSLYKISVAFGPYIKDLNLPVDIELQMNNFISFKEVL